MIICARADNFLPDLYYVSPDIIRLTKVENKYMMIVSIDTNTEDIHWRIKQMPELKVR